MLKNLFACLWYALAAVLLLTPLSGCSAGVDDKPLGDSLPLIVKNQDQNVDTGVRVVVKDGEIMTPVTAVTQYINKDVYLDPTDGKVYYPLGVPQFKLETQALTDRIAVGGELLTFTPRKINEVPCINILGLEKLLGFQLTPTADCIILEKHSYWGQLLNPVKPVWKPAGRINLAWDRVQKGSPALDKEAAIDGLDILSPTWFSVVSANGLVISQADVKYVADAHSKGYKVWALLNNSFDRELTKQLLADDEAQETVIRQMVIYSSLYNLDGINIDFENIYDDDKDKFSRFVEKLTAALKQQNLVVSIDVTVPSKISFWSACFDRKKLADTVDYVAVMTYDEYFAKSRISGPVASLGWVETGVKKTLAEVPKEKLLLGIPLYTRDWEDNGVGAAKSKTMSMPAVQALVTERNLPVTWLADKGLNYTEYYQDANRHRIWIEDERSIALKAGLVNQYDLAGAAMWCRGFETKSIWEVLNTVVKKPPDESR